jgi:uncharacterized protein YecE (DUF72 family)
MAAKIYQMGTGNAQFLDHYVQHFNAIELNATHYLVYVQETIAHRHPRSVSA